jgi:N-carbamoylputrescine amidase
VAGPTGEILVEADRSSEAVIAADFDLDDVARLRRGWGVFRDRRPNLYGPIIELDDSN